MQSGQLVVICAIFLLTFALLHGAGAANVINVAALVTDPDIENGPGALYSAESRAQIRGWKLWEETANNAGGVVVGNVTYLFNLTIINVGYTTSKATNTTRAVIAGQYGNFDLFFGPYSSGLTTAVALELEASDVVMLTAGATSSSIYVCPSIGAKPDCKYEGQRRFQKTWGTHSIAERYYTPIVALLRNRGARNIAIWAEAASFPQSIKNGVKAEANNQKMNVTFERNIPDAPNAEVLSALIDELRQIPNLDAVFAGTYYASSVSFVRLAKEKGWMPKAFVTRIGDVSLLKDLGEDARYLMDSNYWDARLRGDDYMDSLYFKNTSIPAPQQFASAFHARWGEFPGENYEAIAFANGEILHEAIRRGQSVSAQQIRTTLSQLSFTTFFGKISYNALGYNELLPFTAVQRDETNTLQILAPLVASTDDMIYPLAFWEERDQRLQGYQDAAEKVIVAITAVLIAAALGLAVFVIYHSRTHRVIIASSPPFLLLMIVGALIMYTGVILWALYNTTPVCNAVAWCLGVGFIVMYGSLFGRTFRILQIITKSKYRPVKFTNTRLFLFVGILVGVELVILVLWTSISTIQATLIQPDPVRPALDVQLCTFRETDYIFVGILGVYKLLVLIAGVIFSIRIWNFHMAAFNESRQIAFSMYNLVFFSVLAIVAVAALDQVTQRVASYVLRSVSILLAISITLVVLFVPKVFSTLKTPAQLPSVKTIHGSRVGVTSGSKTSGSKPSSYGSTSRSDEELEAQLRIAKSQVRALQERVDQLIAENKKLQEAAEPSKDAEAVESSNETEASDGVELTEKANRSPKKRKTSKRKSEKADKNSKGHKKHDDSSEETEPSDSE